MTSNNTKTKVKHSKSKPAWNVVSTVLGSKYKVARVPYVTSCDYRMTEINMLEALEHADFISWCFNNIYDTFENE